jgi:hypothetical protein
MNSPSTTPRSAKNQTRYFSVPLDLAARIDAAATARGITKSALFREMFQAWEAGDRERSLERHEAGPETEGNGSE